MINYKKYLIMMIAGLMAGCSLDKAPDCIPGREKCASDALTGHSILYVCDQNRSWLAVQSCLKCEKNACSNPNASWSCDVEGEVSCMDIDSLSIQFECVQHHLIPRICSAGDVCIDNRCGKEHQGCQENGERHCMWLDSLGVAMQTVCVDHELVALYCGRGHGCDGDVCEVEQRVVGCIGTGVVWDDTDKACACDKAHHWTGPVGQCECEPGYEVVGKKCEKPSACPGTGEIRNAETNECICDISRHWTGTAGSCVCETGYVKSGKRCEVPVTCTGIGVIRDPSSNTCICDASHHWTGSAGNCACEQGYRLSGGACEPVTCSGLGEVLDENTNTCVCDTESHWTGSAGNCTCETGYVEFNRSCELENECGGFGLIRDEKTGKCSCDTDNHWAGNSGVCVCAAGYYNLSSPNTCVKVGNCLTKDDLNIGDVCTFGRYYQDEAGSVKTDLDWLVLDSIEGHLLLISRYVLKSMPYNVGNDVITWEKCTLRSWLNGLDASNNLDGVDYTSNNFMTTAFTEEEIAYLLPVESETPDMWGYDGGNNTVDRVFILSAEEISMYYTSVAHAIVTEYGIRSGVVTYPPDCKDVQCSGCIWMRSGGEHMSCNAGDIHGGVFCEGVAGVTYGQCLGVRPVILLKRD